MGNDVNVLVALQDKGLAGRVNSAFDGNVHVTDRAGQAVQEFSRNSYGVVILDYNLTDNAVQAAIKIRAASDQVHLLGYLWEKDFAGMTRYNAVSEMQLAYCIGQYIGMDKSSAQNLASRFDNSDQTLKPERK